MRILVLVPNAEFVSAAGARIRYHRIAPHLEALGYSIKLQVIDSLRLRPRPDCDAVLISKCYDARGLLAAAELSGQGILVGADFFDDYYSQTADSRFVHLRGWFQAISGHLSFALCSTPAMKDNLARLAPSLACHMMSDPYEAVDPDRIASRVETKLKRVQSLGILELGWFGIGDNPYFPVGLSDLAAQADGLARLRQHGLSPRLSIITNRRALTPDRLEQLGRLPVPWRLEEWSEEAENRLIERSYACFLPVNAQPFSIAKSLNRAVTALTGGAQVLAAGYPLYDVFAEFIYRDPAGLAADIPTGKPRLRRGTLPALEKAMDRHAGPAAEVAALAAFLAGLPAPRAEAAAPAFAIIHGRSSTSLVHKFTQSNGQLSVAGFRTAPTLAYDVQPAIDPETRETVVQLSARAAAHLREDRASEARPGKTSGGKPCSVLTLPDGFPRPVTAAPAPDSEAAALATYRADMDDVRRLLDHLFGGIRVIVSETAPPFWAEPARTAA